MTKLCICKICNCGRHRCPHRPQTTKGGMCALSEYANRYHSHPIDMRQSFKPVQDVKRADGLIDDKTTHRLDYIRHPLEKPFVHQGEEYVKPAGEFEGLTSYNKDYVPKRTDRTLGAQKEYTRKEPGKFDGQPTYKSDYRQWDLRPTRLAQSQPAWTAPKNRFEGESNYRTDYVRYSAAPRQSCKPNEIAKVSDAALDDQTMYRKAYIPFELAKREPKAKAQWNPNKNPFDALTTFQRDFTPKQGGLSESCKPTRDAYNSDAPFIDDTTHKNDYKKWPTERPHHHEADVYVRPKGEMDMNTTHNLNYTPKPIQRVVQARPVSRQRMPAAFVGNPTYRDDYKKWDIGMREPVTAKDCYVPPKANFEGMPTYKAHYVPHSLQPVGNFKPGYAQLATGEFDGNTMYRVEFVPKAVEPCPAANIDRNPRFAFDDQDTVGHKYYTMNPTTMMPSVCPTQPLVTA